ncbi:MAG: MBL fold metallo-hydrolase, partial [Spirochaetia bacterium]
IPTPLTPERLKRKIAAVVQRIRPGDLESPESREIFMSKLPNYIFGTIGGNTPCIEVSLSDGSEIIFDGGSGLRELGAYHKQLKQPVKEYHIFFSHFHWDHIQGIPFFAPAYDPSVKITFYSPVDDFELYIRSQMKLPYFPVSMKVMYADIKFVQLTKQPMNIGAGQVYWKGVNHPGGCFSYKVAEQHSSMIYSTDTELNEEDFNKTKENISFYRDVDAMILDSQYTLGEAIEKFNWGHTSYSMAVDFAAEWGIRNLYLFHHEPLYDDQKIEKILQSAGWYLEHIDQTIVNIRLAVEGEEFQV